MRRVSTLVLALGLVGAFAFVNPATSAPPDHKNKYSNEEVDVRLCGDDGDTVTYGGPLKLWPPNHKMQDFTITAHEESPGTPDEGNPDAAPTMLEVTPGSVESMSGGDGGENHNPDWDGEMTASGDPDAVVEGALRAERSGRSDGRTYELDWSAEFDDGTKVCTSQVPAPEDQEAGVTYIDGGPAFEVFVPHDMRGGADWK